MKNNSKLMKEYSNWLFQENSIIYEKKLFLTEDAKSMLIDLGQFALGVVGAAPIVGSTFGKFADVANGVIYLARGEYVFSLLSFLCAALPPLADSLAASGVLGVRLAAIAAEGAAEVGVGARIARQIITKIPQIQSSLRVAVPWLQKNKEEIKSAIQAAADKVKEARQQRETSSTNGSEEDRNANIEDAEVVAEGLVSDAISGSLTALTNLLLSNDRIRQLLANPEVVNGLKNAADQIIELLERAQQTFNQIQSTEGSETQSDTGADSAGSTALNEGFVYTDTRFKKLAGLID